MTDGAPPSDDCRSEIPPRGPALNRMVTHQVRRNEHFRAGMRTVAGDVILAVTGAGRGRSIARFVRRRGVIARSTGARLLLDAGDPATAGCLRALIAEQFEKTSSAIGQSIMGRMLVDSSIATAGDTWEEAVARSYVGWTAVRDRMEESNEALT